MGFSFVVVFFNAMAADGDTVPLLLVVALGLIMTVIVTLVHVFLMYRS